MTDFKAIDGIAKEIVELLEEKGKFYGDSWRKRGGPGAFMVMARKWDRIENICGPLGYDIFKALDTDSGGVRDDVKDLVGYLLLILEAAHPLSKAPTPIQMPAPDLLGFTVEGYYGDGTELYKCRACKAEIRTAVEGLEHHTCAPN